MKSKTSTSHCSGAMRNEDSFSLPLWGLPPEIQELISDISRGYQCSPDFCLCAAYAAAATVLGKNIVAAFDNYRNYPSLWLVLVGNASSGKTAPISFFFKPIMHMERAFKENYASAYASWEQSDKKSRGPAPLYRHVLLNNPTDESVLKELSVNSSMCWKADEFRTIIDSFTRYSKGVSSPIVGNLLSIFNNEDVNVTRKTEALPQYLAEPNLSIIGGTQPSVLRQIMSCRGALDDGMFQRFLYCYPEASVVPHFHFERIGARSLDVWSRKIATLSSLSGEVRESASSRAVRITAINRWRKACNTRFAGIDGMVSLMRKLEIHLCRWSLVTSALRGSYEISADDMRYSVECMEHFAISGEKAYNLVAPPRDKAWCQLSLAERCELVLEAYHSRQKGLPKELCFKLLHEQFPELTPCEMADYLGVTRQQVSKALAKYGSSSRGTVRDPKPSLPPAEFFVASGSLP